MSASPCLVVGRSLSDAATATGKAADDPALRPPRDDRDLGARGEVPHLVRDRGARDREARPSSGVVPKSAAKALWDWWGTDPTIDVAAIDAIEAVTRHDVIAFLTWVAEQVGDEARFMHQGMTSSDVLDTTLAVQLARAADILLEDLDALLAALSAARCEHKYTPTIGRSHGIHAEPVTFGLKLAQAYAEFARCRARLVAARAEIATCAISRRGRHLRQHRPGGRGACRRAARAGGRADLDPGDPARPPRDVLRHARRRSPARSSGSRSRSATCSAPKCSRPRNTSRPARRARARCRTSATRC